MKPSRPVETLAERQAIVAAILPPSAPGRAVNVPIKYWPDWLDYWQYRIIDCDPATWPPTFYGQKE